MSGKKTEYPIGLKKPRRLNEYFPNETPPSQYCGGMMKAPVRYKRSVATSADSARLKPACRTDRAFRDRSAPITVAAGTETTIATPYGCTKAVMPTSENYHPIRLAKSKYSQGAARSTH